MGRHTQGQSLVQLTSCSEEKAIDHACSTARVSGTGRLDARYEDGRAERGVGRCREREGERAGEKEGDRERIECMEERVSARYIG
jgi:hypothetical protein